MPVDTKHVTGRRETRFRSLDEALADAERLVGDEETGTLTQLGNWSLGRTLGHLSCWMEMPYDGYPPQINPPWFVKFIVRMMKGRYMNGRMSAGVRIPGIPEGTLGTEEMPTRDALARFRRACQRLKSEPPTRDNPLFGPLTHQEWINLNLSHAMLHLSFFAPR